MLSMCAIIFSQSYLKLAFELSLLSFYGTIAKRQFLMQFQLMVLTLTKIKALKCMLGSLVTLSQLS